LVFVGKYTGIDWGRRVQGRTLLALTNVDKWRSGWWRPQRAQKTMYRC